MVEMEEGFAFQAMGLLLVVLGLLMFMFPYLLRLAPSLERVPWWIIWVYRRDGFIFATSPLLILLSLISFLYNLLR